MPSSSGHVSATVPSAPAISVKPPSSLSKSPAAARGPRIQTICPARPGSLRDLLSNQGTSRIRFGETSPFWNDQPMPAIWQCPRPVFSNREGICPAPFCFCNGQAQSADGGQMISSQRPVAPGEKSRAPAITPRRFFEWRAGRGFPRGNWQRATSMRGDAPDGVSPLGKTRGSKQFWEP
jgi:hypothetical protein